MKEYVRNKIIKFQRSTKKSFAKTNIRDTAWLMLDESKDKIVFVFDSEESKLYHSKNGDVKEGKWKFLIDSDTLIISQNSKSTLFNVYFIEDEFMLLNKDSTTFYFVFANLTKYKEDDKYLAQSQYVKLLSKIIDSDKYSNQDILLLFILYRIQKSITNNDTIALDREIKNLSKDKEFALKVKYGYYELFGIRFARALSNLPLQDYELYKLVSPLMEINVIRKN